MPATVDLDGHDVVVTISGSDRLWGFARELRIPRNEVTNAVALDRTKVRGAWFRVAGTHVPWLKAGWFRTRAGREYWLTRRGERVLVIETSGKVKRVVVETPDPEGDADRILAAR
ncbi:MAG TPA: hypothetical protein VGX28_03640 [Frankiaceae bacterium]|jgi:hypothetical protein|nr:hypothetical protein [Frankiaceae bacterium]